MKSIILLSILAFSMSSMAAIKRVNPADPGLSFQKPQHCDKMNGVALNKSSTFKAKQMSSVVKQTKGIKR